MLKVNETILEIDLNALEHNYTYLKSKLRGDTKIIAVVKAFGYGSDGLEISKKLINLGVEQLAVAYVNEGVSLRKAGIKTPILVLHPQNAQFNALIDACLEPSLYSVKIFDAFLKASEAKQQKNYPIHLKFNTGLNRLGFLEENTEAILFKLSKTDSVKVSSIFSHLAASEDLSERDFSISQIEKFKNISNKLIRSLNYIPLLHMCNTSGILNYPEAHFDLVRSGIGLYGFGNSEKENLNLRPIATLKTIISQIHHLQKGETVGYNRSFVCKSTMKIATLPLGHADGISRAYGNGIGWVTIQDKKAPIIGNVCMDMIMVNVANIDCKEGDGVILFGKETTAEELSGSINSISYELLTAVSQRIKRVFIK